MARGPKGEKRPSNTVGCAITVAKIATGGAEDELPSARRNDGLAGGQNIRIRLSHFSRYPGRSGRALNSPCVFALWQP